jgi:hypothetical protein
MATFGETHCCVVQELGTDDKTKYRRSYRQKFNSGAGRAAAAKQL